MSFKPRCYQAAAVAAVMAKYDSGRRQLMLGLPTGAGKTVVAALLIEELLTRLNGKRVLFLAHRKEIIEQTAEKLGVQIGTENVTIEQAERYADPKVPIVVASVQTLVGRLHDYDPETFGAVIVDECHHAFAKSWLATIGHFGVRRDSLVLGLTATSKRSDGRCVSSLFQETAFEISLGELQELGHLVPLAYYTVEASLGLNKIGLDNEGDFPVSFLGRIMNTPEVIALTVRAWREQSLNLKTIAFCASVAHAEALARAFNIIGVRAACISGQSQDRDSVISDFRKGNIQLLTNFGVLTEGFDEPSIECVLLCRPTRSPLVYTQCLGRGLRSFPGKQSCTVIDIIDRQSHELQYNAFEAAGLKRTWKSPGKDPCREATALAKIRVTDPLAFIKIRNAVSMEETQSILMGLDPKTVLAGIDGMPVPRYTVKKEAIAPEFALLEAERLIKDVGLSALELTCEGTELQARFAEAEKPKLSAYVPWHIKRATGWPLVLHFAPDATEAEPSPHTPVPEFIYERLAEFDESRSFDESGFDDGQFSLIRQSGEERAVHQPKPRKRQGASLTENAPRKGAQAHRVTSTRQETEASIQGLMLALKDELESLDFDLGA